MPCRTGRGRRPHPVFVFVEPTIMQAEILAIGTELLLGATVDTNSAYLEKQLATIGVAVRRVTLVRDDLPEMVAAIRDASRRSELVICSGGLGPTGDDLTREAIATALDRPLEFHQSLLDDIAARFAAYKRPMSPSNRQQAFVPQGAGVRGRAGRAARRRAAGRPGRARVPDGTCAPALSARRARDARRDR